MLTAVRLGGYVGVLGVVFGVAWGGGAVLKPEFTSTPAAVEPHAEDVAAMAEPAAAQAAGVSPTADGYTLTLDAPDFAVNRRADLALTVAGPDGRPVAGLDRRADGAELRALVVRRDGAGFQALYPERTARGGWSAPVRLPTAGAWRVITEFTPTGGVPTTLGTDLFVPGDFAPLDFPAARAAEVGDYTVRLDGDLRAGTESAIFATVSRAGRGVTDLEADRGTFGDIVALRAGDLAVVPVRAQTRAADGDRSGPGIAFTTTVPTEGIYRLYLRFRHAGEEQTVDFTVPTFGTPTTAQGGGGHR
ncbi:hypothetical protein [Pseudonocardia xishanensis]|uniref:YtkA-like protein n=1 Tax=Pseudonocardia xishanensis TaxID=630995 RepID=A0ABP8S364_9PSEU